MYGVFEEFGYFSLINVVSIYIIIEGIFFFVFGELGFFFFYRFLFGFYFWSFFLCFLGDKVIFYGGELCFIVI